MSGYSVYFSVCKSNGVDDHLHSDGDEVCIWRRGNLRETCKKTELLHKSVLYFENCAVEKKMDEKLQ
jgi:hypothetical protein